MVPSVRLSALGGTSFGQRLELSSLSHHHLSLIIFFPHFPRRFFGEPRFFRVKRAHATWRWGYLCCPACHHGNDYGSILAGDQVSGEAKLCWQIRGHLGDIMCQKKRKNQLGSASYMKCQRKKKKLGEASWYTGRTGSVGWLALNNKKRKFHKHVLVTYFFNHALPLRNTRLTSILSINSSH